ncbi:MAG: hypothetical protein JST54_34585 [Deltaproteobacteria bacterium]|nr:hypothetical protein [Deltaproteobacteria bacterium]
MKPYTCPACAAGMVRMAGGTGRTMPFRQLPALAIDDGFELPTCDACGEVFVGKDLAKKLDDHLEDRYGAAMRHRAAAALRVLAGHAKLQEIEHVLGLSQGYLSKIRSESEKKAPSSVLVALLELLSEHPRSLRTLRKAWTHVGGDWDTDSASEPRPTARKRAHVHPSPKQGHAAKRSGRQRLKHQPRHA